MFSQEVSEEYMVVVDYRQSVVAPQEEEYATPTYN